MRGLAKYWKVIFALIMMFAAIPIIFVYYLPGKRAYEAERDALNASISGLRSTIAENTRYADIQDQLPGAEEEVDASREALYQHFPRQLREEDQIMYVLYLEELFGTEITFSFGSVSGLEMLSDGAALGGLTLTVNYETDYQGYKDMIKYLATDSRITSIRYATMDYDTQSDRATGSLTLLCYLMESERVHYEPPEVTVPSTGKPNIFE